MSENKIVDTTVKAKLTAQSIANVVAYHYEANRAIYSRGKVLKACYESAEKAYGKLSKTDKDIIRSVLDAVTLDSALESIPERLEDGIILSNRESIRATDKGAVTGFTLRVQDKREYTPRQSIGLYLSGDASIYAKALRVQDKDKQESAYRKVRNHVILLWQECLENKTATSECAEFICTKMPELKDKGMFAEWLGLAKKNDTAGNHQGEQ